MKFSTIEKAYSTLCTQFQSVCGQANVGCSFVGRGFSAKSVDDEVTINFLMYLKNWPEKRVKQGTKKIHILLSGIEKYSIQQEVATHCDIGVSYLEDAPKNAVRPFVQIHYDYERLVQPGHPVFHAQFGGKEIPPSELQLVGLRQVLLPSEKKGFSSIRIPTPHMSLASVCLGLAADHMEDKHYRNFLKFVRECDVVGWGIASAPLMENLKKSGSVRSHHWYFDKSN
jgi:hypothetical protein